MSEAMIKVSKEAQNIATALEAQIDEIAGKSVGFSLFIWTEGRCTYISNSDRKEIIGVLEGMIEGWKKGMPDIPAHKTQ